jgi:hypothetical protein
MSEKKLQKILLFSLFLYKEKIEIFSLVKSYSIIYDFTNKIIYSDDIKKEKKRRMKSDYLILKKGTLEKIYEKILFITFYQSMEKNT